MINQPTRKKILSPRIIILLIVIVSSLLFIQVLGGGLGMTNLTEDDRESCLNEGNIWSQSAGECYETDDMQVPISKVTTKTLI